MKVSFSVLKAKHGDGIAISIVDDGSKFNILVDGGPRTAFELAGQEMGLKTYLDSIKSSNEKIDLLILTHEDEDHIGGILAAFEKKGYMKDLVEEVWFNSGNKLINEFELNESLDKKDGPEIIRNNGCKTSIPQGIALEDYFSELGIHNLNLFSSDGSPCISRFGCTFDFISPSMKKLKNRKAYWMEKSGGKYTSGKNDYNKLLTEFSDVKYIPKDNSKPNGSSLAFVFTALERKILFLGDAHEDEIRYGLELLGHNQDNKIKVDYVKMSHHGSKNNISNNLLDCFDTNKFIVTTDGTRHNLPNKYTFSLIIAKFECPEIFFNYPSLINKIFHKGDYESCIFEAKEINEIKWIP